MDAESILKPIERFLEVVKGTELEEQALQMKKEIVEVIDDYHLQMKADAACEEYWSYHED